MTAHDSGGAMEDLTLRNDSLGTKSAQKHQLRFRLRAEEIGKKKLQVTTVVL